MSAPAIALRGLVRRFGEVTALDGVDLEIPGPGVHGFLGMNGAGKSTTMRILVGFLRPTAGEARVYGHLARPGALSPRRRLGYLPQHPAFHGWMRAREVVAMAGELGGLSRGEARRRSGELLERMGLGDAARRRVGGFSGGMKQRLGLARALVGRPDLLLLDEPVSALDPVGRAEVLDLVAELGRDHAVFMSTHILADVQRVCDRVAVIHQGRIVAQEATRTLRERFVRPVVEVELDPVDGDPAEVLADLPFVHAVWSGRGDDGGVLLRVELSDAGEARRGIPARLAARGLGLRSLRPVVPDLEEVFMRLVGREP